MELLNSTKTKDISSWISGKIRLFVFYTFLTSVLKLKGGTLFVKKAIEPSNLSLVAQVNQFKHFFNLSVILIKIVSC